MATKAAAAAAVKDHNPAVDRTPDNLPSFEDPHPYASGGGHWNEWSDREQRRDNEAREADIMEDFVAT
eukprot:95564-Pleurochrysis_carterae.AAC.1